MITGVEKIGDVLEVGLRDAISLVKFIKHFMVWDVVDDFLSFSGEKLIRWSEIKNYQFFIYPMSVLVPKSACCHYFENLEWSLKIPINLKKKVILDEPILFESYRLHNNPYGFWSRLKIRATLDRSEINSEKVKLSKLDVRSEYESELSYYYYPLSFQENNTDITELEKSMDELIKSSDNTGTVLCTENLPLYNEVTVFENTLFVIVNFIYSIYNRQFREGTKEYKVFTPFAKLLWGYGESFEEVFSTIKEITAFLG